MAAVHYPLAAERAVGVAGDNPQGEYVLYGVLILARDGLVVRNLLLGLGLLCRCGGEALLGHDVGHQRGHVVPVDNLVHGPGSVVRILETGAGQDAGDGKGLGVGSEPNFLVLFRVVLLDLVGIEGSGQHDAELCARDGVGRPERPVGVAACNPFGGAVHDGRVEAVGGRDVGESGHGGKEFVVGGGNCFGFNGNCLCSILGLHGNVGQARFDTFGVFAVAAVIAIKYDAGVVTGIEPVVGPVGFGGEGRDGHGKHHEKRECGRECAADGNAVLDSHRKYLTFTKKFN